LEKNLFFVIIIGTVFQYKAFGQQLAPIVNGYGVTGMPYGESRHPGIDFLTTLGTPIVAVSDGIVVFTGDPHKDKIWGGGFAVILKNTDTFFSLYYHLSKVFVTNGQNIKRGERLGLSGKSSSCFYHLYFGLKKNMKKDSGLLFSQSYNPNDFWLNGKPQCFDPHKEYSKYSNKEITFPVECPLSK